MRAATRDVGAAAPTVIHDARRIDKTGTGNRRAPDVRRQRRRLRARGEGALAGRHASCRAAHLRVQERSPERVQADALKKSLRLGAQRAVPKLLELRLVSYTLVCRTRARASSQTGREAAPNCELTRRQIALADRIAIEVPADDEQHCRCDTRDDEHPSQLAEGGLRAVGECAAVGMDYVRVHPDLLLQLDLDISEVRFDGLQAPYVVGERHRSPMPRRAANGDIRIYKQRANRRKDR